MIFCYLLCYLQLVFGEGFSPNVRYHAPHANASFNYSYVNLKYLKGHKLDITPLLAITVRNRTHCVRKCLSKKYVCQSINTEKVSEVSWDCEILSSDVYNNPGKLISHPEVVHSVLANRCLKSPCKEGERCIPDYTNDSYSCHVMSCLGIKRLEPNSPSGFYDVYINGGYKKLYCEMEDEGGGWVLLGNYSVPATNIRPRIIYGNLDQFEQLRNGDFLLDNKAYLSILKDWIDIKEFRFYCHKVSTGRTIHVMTAPQTTWGAYIHDYIFGKVDTPSCNPNCESKGVGEGINALPDDNSFMSSVGIGSVGWGLSEYRLYDGPFFRGGPNGYHFLLNQNRQDCDDEVQPASQATWRFYAR
ncbi:uncharacterized protein [Clytia hemisphaerica]|uniref:Fibrinogen C-terminal domain-containing protein n=1 Tax=Clytia hemisphaerica TaxID=252671 RepID=A0A7M5VE46_9CNID